MPLMKKCLNFTCKFIIASTCLLLFIYFVHHVQRDSESHSKMHVPLVHYNNVMRKSNDGVIESQFRLEPNSNNVKQINPFPKTKISINPKEVAAQIGNNVFNKIKSLFN